MNTPLRQLSELFSTLRAIVVGVRREGRLFVPEPEDQLYPGDDIYVFADADDVYRTMEIFGKDQQRSERFIIIGGGNVGRAIATRLEADDRRIRAKVIEKSREIAEEAADALERTIVLHGDGLDMNLLEEANIDRADAVLAMTDDDKTNLLSSARAKAVGVPLVISLVNDPSLVSLLQPLKIDAYINPRATTVSSCAISGMVAFGLSIRSVTRRQRSLRRKCSVPRPLPGKKLAASSGRQARLWEVSKKERNC
jgi:trk system potassium uptake protein TrkA